MDRRAHPRPGGAIHSRVAPSSHRSGRRGHHLRVIGPSPRGSPSRTPRRLIALFFILMLAFGGMLYRLVDVQVLQADRFQALAAEQRERDVEVPARRGAILDRNGDPLAISVDLKMVYTDPVWVEDADATAAKLAPVLGARPETLEKKLRGSFPGDRFEYLARQVLPKTATRIAKLDLPGVYMRGEPKRYYPGGTLASHVLGFVNIDGTVRAGIEAQYQKILHGRPGHLTLEQDPTGRALLQAEFDFRPADPGRELFLTLDKDLQYFTELTLADATKRYHAESGTAIVMHVETGEILALANVPDFSPNHPGDAEQEAQRNRAVTDVYEPGSAFKIVTVAAALEEGTVTPKTRFEIPDAFQYLDRVFNDSHTHPTETMTVQDILEQSSNVGTIKIGLELGKEKLHRWVRRFGFGSRTGLDFPGEVSGIVLPTDLWSGTTVATVPIGQGVAVTALQMAAAYGMLANEGVWVEPKLLHSTMDATGEVKRASLPASKRVVARKTARQMRKMLERVVEKGTGVAAQIPGYRVAGKTGTAQKPLPGGGYGASWIGSFVGFAPADDPMVVTLVMLDEPSPIWGGATAAPTFRTIMEYALRHLGASPSGNAEKAAREIEAEQAEATPAHD